MHLRRRIIILINKSTFSNIAEHAKCPPESLRESLSYLSYRNRKLHRNQWPFDSTMVFFTSSIKHPLRNSITIYEKRRIQIGIGVCMLEVVNL